MTRPNPHYPHTYGQIITLGPQNGQIKTSTHRVASTMNLQLVSLNDTAAVTTSNTFITKYCLNSPLQLYIIMKYTLIHKIYLLRLGYQDF